MVWHNSQLGLDEGAFLVQLKVKVDSGDEVGARLVVLGGSGRTRMHTGLARTICGRPYWHNSYSANQLTLRNFSTGLSVAAMATGVAVAVEKAQRGGARDL